MKFKRIIINKNRGWRGLAELLVYDAARELQARMVFSFSQPVWEDMLDGKIVTQDKDYYYIIHFDSLECLPKKTQQRSVLIKNFMANVTIVDRIEKAHWTDCAPSNWMAITHFLKNKNNHTTSDWNCIGVRVTPEI